MATTGTEGQGTDNSGSYVASLRPGWSLSFRDLHAYRYRHNVYRYHSKLGLRTYEMGVGQTMKAEQQLCRDVNVWSVQYYSCLTTKMHSFVSKPSDRYVCGLESTFSLETSDGDGYRNISR